MRPETQSLLANLLNGELSAAQAQFSRVPDSEGEGERACAMRHAAALTGQSFLYYQNLHNIWTRWGRPPLKPNPVKARIHLLSDLTVQGLVPSVELFSAAFGIDVEVNFPGFDSVEHVALSGELKGDSSDQRTGLAVLILSEHWLSRYFGSDVVVGSEGFERCRKVLASIVDSLAKEFGSRLIVALFPGKAFPMPGGSVSGSSLKGWNTARREINHWMLECYGENHCFIDVPDALSRAGGSPSFGRSSFLRARMPYEPAGVEAVAREIVAVAASLLGKSHRALITDFDNTLWGGVIADLGAEGVLSGTEAAGFGYHLIQKYVGSLGEIGILLAGLSRNEAAVVGEIDSSPSIALRKDDFTALEVGHAPKSVGVGRISEALAFGSEFMVLLDDSIFELIECLSAHPFLDVLRAGPDPETTLSRLSASRYFHAARLSSADIERSGAAKNLSRQREVSASFASVDDFLREIEIRLSVSGLTSENEKRVEQLFQKTNQFNLTTRRHSLGDIQRIVDNGSTLAVFSYEDSFGPQGIISVLLIENGHDEVTVDSWLMSCRVLNRGVEQAAFCWLVGHAAGRRIRAEYIPTDKNGLVSGLLGGLGFKRVADRGGQEAGGATFWEISDPASLELPTHFATLSTN